MNFEAAKCPNCGASIQVDSSAKIAFCMSCGSALIPKEAIELKIKGLSTAENDLERGQQCLDVNDWQSAFQMYNNALVNQADYFPAWLGCLEAMTEQFTTVASWVKLVDYMGLESVLNNCLKYSNTDEQRELYDQLGRLIDSIKKSEENDYQQRLYDRQKSIDECEQNKKQYYRRQLIGLTIATPVFVIIFNNVTTGNQPLGIGSLLTMMVLCLIAIIVAKGGNKESYQQTKARLVILRTAPIEHDHSALSNIRFLSEFLHRDIGG